MSRPAPIPRDPLSALTAHIAVLDGDGRIVEVNDAWTRFARDHAGDEARCGAGASYLGECDRAAARGDSVAAVVAEGLADVLARRSSAFSLEYACDGPSVKRWFRMRVTPLHGAGGGGAVVAHEDVTLLRLVEVRPDDESSHQRQRARLGELGALAARVVDHVGNPLTGILNHAQLLRRRIERGAEPATTLAAANELIEVTRHLAGVVEALRRFSWDQRLERETVDAETYLRGVLADFESQAIHAGVVLELRLEDGLPPLSVDPIRLRPVLEHLLRNALEASPVTCVTLRARRLGEGRARLSVIDDGSGFPEGLDLFRLFQTSKPDGSGLGLAISKEIALAHGGDLTVEPRTPRGTAVHVDLPVAAGARMPTLATA